MGTPTHKRVAKKLLVYKDLINHLGVISLAVTSQFGGDQNRSLCSLIEAVLSSRRNSEFTVVSYPRLVSKWYDRRGRRLHGCRCFEILDWRLCSSLWEFVKLVFVDILQNQSTWVLRHWYRHILVAFSPGGILPLPFPVWLGFPDWILIICYHIYRSDARHACVFVFSGLGSCGALCHRSRFEARWGHRLADKKAFSRVKACLAYCAWWYSTGRELTSQSPLRVSLILQPCVLGRIGKTYYQTFLYMVGCPGAMTSSARKYLRFLSERKQAVRLTFSTSCHLWSRSYQWLDKIERKLWKSVWSCYGSGAERTRLKSGYYWSPFSKQKFREPTDAWSYFEQVLEAKFRQYAGWHSDHSLTSDDEVDSVANEFKSNIHVTDLYEYRPNSGLVPHFNG